MFKKLLLLFWGVVLSAVVFEIGLRSFDTSEYLDQMETFLSGIQDVEESTFADVTKRHLTSYKHRPKSAHPYFGYVYNNYFSEKFNKDGFLDSTDFSKIDEKKDESFYIAILGGSVASNFAIHEQKKIKTGRPSLISLLKLRSPSIFKGRKAVLINLAIDGHKQPQQFFVSSYFLEKIDMAIIIDGFNEVSYDFPIEFPAEFPGLSSALFSQGPERNKKIFQIVQLIESQIAFTQFLDESALKHVHIVGKIWQLYIHITQRILTSLSHVKNERSVAYYEKPLPLERRIEKQVGVWKKYSLLQAQLYRGQNIPHFHFLQPNQHVKGTKVLSNQEKKLFLNVPMFESVNEGYRLLAQAQQQIFVQGYAIINLTDVFKNITESVYSDSCCHLNGLGNEIMRDNIVEAIVSESPK